MSFEKSNDLILKIKHLLKESNAEILIDFDILSLIKKKNIFGFSVSF